MVAEPSLGKLVASMHDASESVVLRYRRAVRLEEDEADDAAVKELLSSTSLREGLRVVALSEYRGVELHVLDETSWMHTHTLKAVDGCVTLAKCLQRGDSSLVVESGGNTALALAAYAVHAGLEVTCVVPEENLDLLDGTCFDGVRARLLAVPDPARVKPVAAALCRRLRAPKVPEVAWRQQASAFVGCFLAEHLAGGRHYAWIAQTVSAGFGPLGIYRVIERFAGERALPRFLGVQQAANCPLYRAWKGAGSVEPVRSTKELLSRVMYDGHAAEYGTFPSFEALLTRTRGDLTTIDRAEFERWLGPVRDSRVLEDLARAGIRIAVDDGKVVDPTGLLAIAGTLKEIDSGVIATGSRVLVCLTSGARPRGRPAQVAARVESPQALEAYLEEQVHGRGG